MDASDHDTLIEVAKSVRDLVIAVKDLDAKVEKQDVAVPLAIQTEKVSRLEKIVYGCIAAIGLEFLGGIIALVVWLVKGRTP